MKLGLVLECDVGGPDELVLTCLARRLNPKVQIEATSLGSKEQVFLKGAETARNLVEIDKCDQVLIVWDLKPFWNTDARSCEAEADELRESIAGMPAATRTKIKLLCLTWELETWLIADPKVIGRYLSKPAHPVKCRYSGLETKSDPKAFLNDLCRRHRGPARRYQDFKEAILIARLIPDTRKLRKIQSFQRYATFLTQNPDSEFVQGGDACKDLCHQAFRMGA